jgi:uncharacterized membrane protein YkoI
MRLRYLLAAFALSALAVDPAAAQFRDRRGDMLGQTLQPGEVREAAREGRHVQLRDIVAQIQPRYPGRLLDQRLERGQPSIYVIDWLTNDGRKLIIRANAETGAILSVSGG